MLMLITGAAAEAAADATPYAEAPLFRHFLCHTILIPIFFMSFFITLP